MTTERRLQRRAETRRSNSTANRRVHAEHASQRALVIASLIASPKAQRSASR
jgi:hypothetical protein